MNQPKPKESLFSGTGSATWIFYVIAYGVGLYFFLPKGEYGMVGLLAAAFAAQKLDSNLLKKRILNLERLHQAA
jgi:hypothetical protein